MTISDNRSEREAQAILDTLTAALIAWVVAIAAVPAVEQTGWRIGLIVLTAFVVLGFVERGVVNFYLLARQSADGGRQNIELQLFHAFNSRDKERFNKVLRRLRYIARLSPQDYDWATSEVATYIIQLEKEAWVIPNLTESQRKIVETVHAEDCDKLWVASGGRKKILTSLLDALDPIISAYFIKENLPSAAAS